MTDAEGIRRGPATIQQAGQDAAALCIALGITAPTPVVLITGGADTFDPSLIPKLSQLIGRGLIRAAQVVGAVFVDGGTDAGVMALIGRVAGTMPGPIRLIGVAPEALVRRPDISSGDEANGRVALAPNQTHVVLTPGESWGAETPVMFDLAQAIAGKLPVIVVMIGGGQVALSEILHAVRRRWRVLIIEGSKGSADGLLAQWTTKVATDDDPLISEILADGDLHAFPIGGSPDALARRILRELGGDSTVRQAWLRFGALDQAAVDQQKFFRRMQGVILTLTVGVTASVVLRGAAPDRCRISGQDFDCKSGLHYLVIIAPIILSILIAWTNRFHHGNRWVLTRAAAEAIKREIFQFRARAGAYRDETACEKSLAQAIEDVTRRLARTEVNTTAVPIYSGPIPPKYAVREGDDGISRLPPGRYIEVRLDDQLIFFRKKAVTLDSLLQSLQWWIIGVGGLGTLLAAIGFDLWVALTTAIAAALATYLSYRGVDATLTNYHQTAVDLENIKGWWAALLPDEQRDPSNIDALIKHTEQALATELSGWAQRMQDALADLRKEKERHDDRKEGDRAVADSVGRISSAAER